MPTVGLSMITKNEGVGLRQCLMSVRGVVDEIVIADTGSTDNTISIARECAAKVFSVEWDNDFATARNATLERITTDWVLSLDADEELDHEAERALPQLLLNRDVAGYFLPIRNYALTAEVRAGNCITKANDHRHERAKASPSYFLYEKCRLFQRKPEIYFTGRVHEQVEVSIRAQGWSMGAADICIHNFGLLMDRGDMRQKIIDYRNLLRLRVNDDPRDFRGWAYLGRMEYDSFNNRAEAFRCFEKSLEINPGCVEALLFSAMICLDLGRSEQAKLFLGFEAPNRESAIRRQRLLGDAYSQSGELEHARDAYRQALAQDENDPEIASLLGSVEMKLGMAEQGIKRLELAAVHAPTRPDIGDRLMKAYILANRLSEAAAVALHLTDLVSQPRMFLRAASIFAMLKQWQDAEALLDRGLQLFPDAVELLKAKSEVLAASGTGE